MFINFLFPKPLGSQCVYLIISPFLSFHLFWTVTLCPVIFYFFSYSDHSMSIYLFSFSITSCCSGWTLYVQSFSISPAIQITVCLLIYFPFPLLPAILVGYYMFSCFLFSQLLGSQYWSSCSRNSFLRFAPLFPCLKNIPSFVVVNPLCRNGVLEEGEECDCNRVEVRSYFCMHIPCHHA